jgi:hypothetical protein
MVRLLEVSRSGYYVWLDRKPSERMIRREGIEQKVAWFHGDSNEVYGSPRILADLRADGETLSRKTVAKTMQRLGLVGIKTNDNEVTRCRLRRRDLPAVRGGQRRIKAIHFGAGNIGRGFVGLVLHEAGDEVVFADVNAALIDLLQAAPRYRVFEVGVESSVHVVDNFRALNSDTRSDQLVHEIANADIVTTAVGPNIFRFVAFILLRGWCGGTLTWPRSR